MSNFLRLCQLSRQECGLAGDGPTSVDSQTGVMKKVVDRTQRAWVDIQASRPYWKFLRSQITFVLTPGVREYSISTDLNTTTVDKWDIQSSWIYATSGADETKLAWIDYQRYRNLYRTFPAGRPTRIVETPGDSIAFDKTPDQAYTITLDYWQTAEKLTANTDIPLCPEQFHDVIVWKSVMMFSGNETATELFAHAKSMYQPMYAQLVVDQGDMPPARNDYPIAKGSSASSTYRTF